MIPAAHCATHQTGKFQAPGVHLVLCATGVMQMFHPGK